MTTYDNWMDSSKFICAFSERMVRGKRPIGCGLVSVKHACSVVNHRSGNIKHFRDRVQFIDEASKITYTLMRK